MSALADLFEGLVFYGTGGGGRAEAGLALLRDHFGPAWVPQFISPDRLPQDTMAAATIVIGGRDPDDDFSPLERTALGLPVTDLGMALRFEDAVKALSAHLPRPIGALAVVELGSLATAATMIAADRLGIPVLDADCTGRSIPELGLTKMDLAGMAAAPLALVDRFGAATVLSGEGLSSGMADRMARQISRAVMGRGLGAVAYPAPLARFSRGLVGGSIAAAWDAGRILRGTGPVGERLGALLGRTGGTLVAKARAVETAWRSREPYSFREFDYRMTGLDSSEGREIRIFVKNEHHVVWVDSVPVATSPDVIAVLDAATLLPTTTLGDVRDGQDVFVVACPALDDCWRSREGLALLGPRRFGIDAGPVIAAVSIR